jgi:hypothetical protein
MQVQDAQREVRTVFAGGFWGQLVSSAIWLASAALGTWGTPRAAILLIVAGGFFIFPVTQLLLRGANLVPGRDFHPQSSSAFPRRTCNRRYYDSYRSKNANAMNEHTPKAIASIPKNRKLHCFCSYRSVILGMCRPVHEFSTHRR